MTDNTAESVDVQTLTDHGAPSQLIPPDSDAGMRLFGYRADRLAYVAPGVITLIVGGVGTLYGGGWLAGGIIAIGAVLTLLGGYLLATTPSHTSGVDRMKGWLSYAVRKRSLPYDRATAEDIHGVAGIRDDGSVEMTDGRIVRFARLFGRNTDLQTSDQAQAMISSLRRGVDGSLSGVEFSVYSTATSSRADALTDKYHDVWLSDRYDRETSGDTVGYLRSLITFEQDIGESWKETMWKHYLVIQVSPGDGSDDGSRSADTRQQQCITASSRLDDVREAFDSVAGIETRHIDAKAHARCIASHWAGTRHVSELDSLDDDPVSVWPAYDGQSVGARSTPRGDLPPLDPSVWTRLRQTIGELAPSVTGEQEGSVSPIGENQVKTLLGASRWDERPSDDLVVVGDQLARTYWIADWPTHPTATWLKELYTLRGIDVDVHLRFQSKDEDQVKQRLEQTVGEIDASISERSGANALDASVLKDEMDSFVQLYKLIHHTEAQPWGITAYVTVRAGTRTALAHAESLIEQGYDDNALSVDLAKHRALESACEEVEDVLTRADLVPKTDPSRQAELFRSAAPTGRDVYAETSTRTRERLTGTGTVAATFPSASTTVQHPNGIELGRNPTNGRIIAPDPFETPPAHKLTIGKSGSGKSWATCKQAARWYLADPDDRSLVFIDAQQGFSGVTELLNGQTIAIDADTTMNPLRMEPMDPEFVERARLDPFRAKHRLVTGLILDLVAETEQARERYQPLLRDGVEAAMEQSGIVADDPTTHTPANSPTMADVRQAVEEIAEEPSSYVRSGHEAAEIEEHAGALLRRLSSFEQGGEYGFLTGQSDAVIEPGEVTYLDMQQIEGIGAGGERAAMLLLALGQVYEMVKRSPGQTLFVIDEAHYLLESERLLQVLEESARHWRHTESGLWFVSQHPSDFVEAEDDDEARYKNVIRDQAQSVEFFRTDDGDALDHFGLNSEQISYLQEEATMGSERAASYSNCLLDHPDVEGLLKVWVEISDAEASIFKYDPEQHGSYDSYIDRNWTQNNDLAPDGGDQ